MLVFLAMGLGLAAPYGALALVPGLVRRAPRPGRWMDILKQALAFPMYAAAAWLLWVVSQETGSDGVLAAPRGSRADRLCRLGARGRAARRARPARAPARAAAALAALLAALAVLAGSRRCPARSQRRGGGRHRTFTAARLAALRADGRPVFVNMTAAWCVTCLVNERVALSTAAVQRAFAERSRRLPEGRLDAAGPAITAFLREHGRDGVPLYVFYPRRRAPSCCRRF